MFVLNFLSLLYTMKQNYTPDILGNGFEQLQIDMPNDYEGRVVCTLVRKKGDTVSSKAVLYVHGFNDYFFQEELAQRFIGEGYSFYAIDLRKSGRSILTNQTPYNLRSIEEYFADLDAAIIQIREEGNTSLTLLAHSTGGLTTALYLHGRGSVCDALILNSPFLEINKSWEVRRIGMPIASALATLFPNVAVKSNFSSFYGQSLHVKERGEWDYRLDWKPIRCDAVTMGWVRGIYKAHRKVKQGLAIQCPVLVMSSDKSVRSREWTDEYLRCDGVLSVEHIQYYADRLGKNVTKHRFANGMHDLILSPEPVRSQVYEFMFAWLKQALHY